MLDVLKKTAIIIAALAMIVLLLGLLVGTLSWLLTGYRHDDTMVIAIISCSLLIVGALYALIKATDGTIKEWRSHKKG